MFQEVQRTTVMSPGSRVKKTMKAKALVRKEVAKTLPRISALRPNSIKFLDSRPRPPSTVWVKTIQPVIFLRRSPYPARPNQRDLCLVRLGALLRLFSHLQRCKLALAHQALFGQRYL